jgi:aminopeptidase C
MEKEIKIAAKLYECRDTAKKFFKELYPEKIKPYVSLINAVAKANNLDKLHAVLKIAELKTINNDGFAMMMVMAAAVEIIEPSKDIVFGLDIASGKDVAVTSEICYKSGKPCIHNCKSICRESV